MTARPIEAITALLSRPDIGPALVVAIEAFVSLLFVLALYALARGLRLGGDVRLIDEAHAARLADEAQCGFDAVDIALDRARIGALVRNAQGQVMLIRRHGARFVGRELLNYEGIRLDRQFLTLDTGDRRFGMLTLDLGPQAQHWAASLRRLGTAPVQP